MFWLPSPPLTISFNAHLHLPPGMVTQSCAGVSDQARAMSNKLLEMYLHCKRQNNPKSVRYFMTWGNKFTQHSSIRLQENFIAPIQCCTSKSIHSLRPNINTVAMLPDPAWMSLCCGINTPLISDKNYTLQPLDECQLVCLPLESPACLHWSSLSHKSFHIPRDSSGLLFCQMQMKIGCCNIPCRLKQQNLICFM